MINKEAINQTIEEWMSGSDFFLVDLTITPDNQISVEIETEKGSVNIDDCVALSQYIESKFDREAEDYSLEVASAGIGQAFKILKQYVKHIGNDVEVKLKNGQKFTGVLMDAQADQFTVSVPRKWKPEGAKRPVIKDMEETYAYQETLSVKYKLNF